MSREDDRLGCKYAFVRDAPFGKDICEMCGVLDGAMEGGIAHFYAHGERYCINRRSHNLNSI